MNYKLSQNIDFSPLSSTFFKTQPYNFSPQRTQRTQRHTINVELRITNYLKI